MALETKTYEKKTKEDALITTLANRGYLVIPKINDSYGIDVLKPSENDHVERICQGFSRKNKMTLYLSKRSGPDHYHIEIE